VVVTNLLYIAPLLQSFGAQLVLAHLAKVFNLSFVRTTLGAEVVKENVNLEVVADNLTFVFSYVFGTQLHLAALDVVSILNEGSVKHQAANVLGGKALVVKHNFGVASHSK